MGKQRLCSICNKYFASNFTLIRHQRTIHGGAGELADHFMTNGEEGPICCSETGCFFKFDSTDLLAEHLEIVHGAKIENKKLQLCTIEEFRTWKTSVEKEDKCLFISQNAKKRTFSDAFDEHEEQFYYECFRSGAVKSVPVDHQGDVLQDGCKSNRSCIAAIKGIKKGYKISITFRRTYCGHVKDILVQPPLPPKKKQQCPLPPPQHNLLSLPQQCLSSITQQCLPPPSQQCLPLPLPQHHPPPLPVTQQQSKAPLISQFLHGMWSNAILNSIQKSFYGTFERLHLAEGKDVCNIQQAFKLTYEHENYEDDVAGLSVWVKNLKKLSGNSIVMCKEQGEDLEVFEKQDFVLGILLEDKEESLKKFGHKEIMCVDSTYDWSDCDFRLIALMVMDERKNSLPVAFLCTNRKDHLALKAFVMSLEARTGQSLPNVFYT